MNETKTANTLNEVPEVEKQNENENFELVETDTQQVDTFKNQIIALDNQSVMDYGREQQQQLSQYVTRSSKRRC